MITTVEMEAVIKVLAMAKPIPAVPPVIRTVLPAWLSSGQVAAMEGEEVRWMVRVTFVAKGFWVVSAIVRVGGRMNAGYR